MKQTIHSTLYFLALGTIAVTMTVSVWACNLAWVVLFANWVFDWVFSSKEHRSSILSNFRTNRLLQAFVALFLLQLIGLLWTSNYDYAMDAIRKSFPLLAVPMVLLTAQPLNDNRIGERLRPLFIGNRSSHRLLGNILFCYIVGIAVSCIVGLIRYFTIPDLPYRKIVPFLSHIRFSLNLCLAIVLLIYQVIQSYRVNNNNTGRTIAAIGLSVFFLAFLFLLQSYTGILILSLLILLTVIFYGKHIPSTPLRNALYCILAIGIISVIALSGFFLHDYFHLKPLSTEPLKAQTCNGNSYTHHKDGFIENGNYVLNYICDKELEEQWPRLSNIPLDSITPNGFSVRPTLYRYLNALGTTKDSLGLTLLTKEDIVAIENGIANPVYRKTLSIKRMYFVMCYEFESYRRYRSVKDFTMLQRFELWRTGIQVIAQHPLFGTGTGDVVDECHAQLAANHSPLEGTTKHTHNQYLTFIITYGIIGFGILLFVFGRSLSDRKLYHYYPFFSIVIIFLLSCLTEDTLETLAGDMFMAFFFCLFYNQQQNQNQLS